MFKRLLFLILIFNTTVLLTTCGQKSLSSEINEQCKNKSLQILGIDIKYPITVEQATKIYDLTYYSNGYFYKTLPFGPAISKNVPYNFKLVFSGNIPYNDVIPSEEYSDRIVKGYEFIFKPSIDYDSLKSSLLNQFKGKYFVQKEKIYPEGLEYLSQTQYSTLDILTISPCTSIVMYKDKKASSLFALIWLVVYFDLTEEEIRRHYL